MPKPNSEQFNPAKSEFAQAKRLPEGLEAMFDENGLPRELWPFRDEMKEWGDRHLDDFTTFLEYRRAIFKLIYGKGFYHQPGTDKISLSVPHYTVSVSVRQVSRLFVAYCRPDVLYPRGFSLSGRSWRPKARGKRSATRVSATSCPGVAMSTRVSGPNSASTWRQDPQGDPPFEVTTASVSNSRSFSEMALNKAARSAQMVRL